MTNQMTNKTILITGATGGIGKETAVGLAKLDATLYIVGRNVARGQAAEADIRQQSGNKNVHFIAADLITKAGVSQLAQTLRQKLSQLDVLINNAGGLYGQRWETADGFEALWAMNHLSPFLLTWELLPLLKAAASARVINLTTSGHRFAKIDFDNLQGETSYVGLGNYGNAKLANLMVMTYWATELQKQGVSFFAADPGGASTEMTDQMSPEFVPSWMRLLWPLMKLSFGRQDPVESRRKAARSSIVAATAPELVGKTAVYLAPSGKIGKAARRANNRNQQEKLWHLTLSQLGLASAPSSEQLAIA